MQNREQRISQRAYAIWEREGRPHGQAEQHWLVAESEIDQETAEQPAAGKKKVSRSVAKGAKQPPAEKPAKQKQVTRKKPK